MDRDFRQRGIASNLVQAAVGAARLAGLHTVRLEAHPSANGISPAALVGMYRKLGFRTMGLSPRGNPVMQLPVGGPRPLQPPIQAKFAGRPVIQRMELPPDEQQVWPSTLTPVVGTLGSTGASGEHHPLYYFQLGTGEKESYDLDLWTTKKTSKPLNPSALKQLDFDLKTIVDTSVAKWNTNNSIVDELLEGVLGSPVQKWESSAFDPRVAQNEEARRVVEHLLAVKASIAQREGDLTTQLPQTITLNFTAKMKPIQPQAISLNWLTTLKSARELLKAQLKQGTAVPARKEDITLATDAILAKSDPGIGELLKYGYLDKKGKTVVNPTYKPTAVKYAVTSKIEPATFKSESGKETDVEFNFGVNHLRFILYLEWRTVTELLQ